MDNELILLQFEEIEQKVEELINRCKSFKTTNTDLNNRIEHLEKELQEKVDIENNYIEERDLVRSKIDGLLNRLEEKEEGQY
ncbi:hypothetical protein BuS5_02874 [Desulfosarcina sp. BuS5]|uniref:hypothetical protein n=1 Tax=Desulfosarcina sp. BuS5 TaxID=933262 RepID=UPI00048020DE|nr:hypothetical protein [Desulfosarcina sp. BuS5]WDN89904.1 hypothetical protein BuS5_02874 [Desulfosarcina sp. BuS5]